MQKFASSDVGRLAACQPVASEVDAILVLGVVGENDEQQETPGEPLVLRRGESVLILAPDGSIRLEGRSLGVRTKGAIKFNGATVELN